MLYIAYISVFLLLITAPLLVLTKHRNHVQPLRLIFAILITYACLNIAHYSHRRASFETYEACQGQFSDGLVQHHAECGEPNISDGATYIFLVLFGWVPATGYIGFWELIRRIKNRNHITSAANAGWKIWFSNIVILFVMPLCFYISVFIIVMITVLYQRHIKPAIHLSFEWLR